MKNEEVNELKRNIAKDISNSLEISEENKTLLFNIVLHELDKFSRTMILEGKDRRDEEIKHHTPSFHRKTTTLKVKLFSEDFEDKLEKAVNNFIKDIKPENLIDIKYSVASVDSTKIVDDHFVLTLEYNAMIIYKEEIIKRIG